jgi:hypothetical protein
MLTKGLLNAQRDQITLQWYVISHYEYNFCKLKGVSKRHNLNYAPKYFLYKNP